METYYLVDLENVHDDGLKHLVDLPKTDHVHIFYTVNAPKISCDVAFDRVRDVVGYKVASGDQSLDKHLVSYLGFLLCENKGKDFNYVIVSKDKGYGNVINFWAELGYTNISRLDSIPGKKKTKSASKDTKTSTSTSDSTLNSKIRKGLSADLSGDERSQLNNYVQHELLSKKYSSDVANHICKIVIGHINDKTILSGIHNELKKEYENSSEILSDIKVILDKYISDNEKKADGKEKTDASKDEILKKKEAQIRSLYGRKFKKKVCVENKEKTIEILLKAKTRQAVNNELLKLYSDNELVSKMLTEFQAVIKELPGR